MDTKKIFKHIPWVILGIIGAFCLSVVALRRGEHVSGRFRFRLSGGLPLLQPVHRPEGHETRPDARDAGGYQ